MNELRNIFNEWNELRKEHFNEWNELRIPWLIEWLIKLFIKKFISIS